jgi:hypothetical protein
MIPVGEEMEDRLCGPHALVKEVAVFHETARVQNAACCNSPRPVGFAEVVDSRPHEVSRNIVTGFGELQKLSSQHHAAVKWHANGRRRKSGFRIDVAPQTATRDVFAPDNFTEGEGHAILVAVGLGPKPPTVDVVVSDHIQSLEI